jgi:hypothetical protein
MRQHPCPVVRVDQRLPGIERRRQFILAIAEHLAPARRVVDLVGTQVPVPQAVAGACHRQREALLAALQIGGPLGDAFVQPYAPADQRIHRQRERDDEQATEQIRCKCPFRVNASVVTGGRKEVQFPRPAGERNRPGFHRRSGNPVERAAVDRNRLGARRIDDIDVEQLVRVVGEHVADGRAGRIAGRDDDRTTSSHVAGKIAKTEIGMFLHAEHQNARVGALLVLRQRHRWRYPYFAGCARFERGRETFRAGGQVVTDDAAAPGRRFGIGDRCHEIARRIDRQRLVGIAERAPDGGAPGERLLIRADFIARQQRNDGKSPEMPILEEMRRLDVPRELGFADMISGADKREHVADPRMRGVDGMRDTLGEARCMKIQCRARLDLQGAAHIEVEPRKDR